MGLIESARKSARPVERDRTENGNGVGRKAALSGSAEERSKDGDECSASAVLEGMNRAPKHKRIGIPRSGNHAIEGFHSPLTKYAPLDANGIRLEFTNFPLRHMLTHLSKERHLREDAVEEEGKHCSILQSQGGLRRQKKQSVLTFAHREKRKGVPYIPRTLSVISQETLAFGTDHLAIGETHVAFAFADVSTPAFLADLRIARSHRNTDDAPFACLYIGGTAADGNVFLRKRDTAHAIIANVLKDHASNGFPCPACVA